MEWIENQPVFFGDLDACSDDEQYPVQLVDNTDETQVQFTLEPCAGADQLMPDPNFEDPASFTLGENWTIEDGMLCVEDATSGGASSVYQFDTTKYYQINIIVDSVSVGGSVDVYLGLTFLGTISAIGEYTYYASPTSALTGIIFSPTVTGTDFCVSQITAYEVLTDAIIAVYDTDGTYVTEINTEDDPDQFVQAKNTMTVTIDWGAMGLSNNCYYLCLIGNCSRGIATIENPTFTGEEDWTYGDGWTNDGGVPGAAVGTYLPLSTNCLSQENVFNAYISQSISVLITTLTGGTGLNVYFGTALVGTITTTGTTVVTGIPVGSLDLSFCPTAGTTTVVVKTVNGVELQPEDYVCDMQSNTFRLADYSNDCTVLINACNNEDGLGFVFEGSGFTPRIRLEAKMKQPKYANERTVYEDSAGKKRTVYFSGRKQQNLCIDLQPEYVHDFLRFLLGFDNVYIDSEPYFVDDDEYNVEYSDASDSLGKVRILVSKRTQNVKQINCTDDENVCTLPPDFLLQADDLSLFITQTDGNLFLING